MGSPIVLLLIPTSHKLQTKVNLFLKGGVVVVGGAWVRGGTEYGPHVSARESDSKTYLLFATTTDHLP